MTDHTRGPCAHCGDTGMYGYKKPMGGLDGKIHMVFVPQRCWCEAGLKLAQQQFVAPVPINDLLKKE